MRTTPTRAALSALAVLAVAALALAPLAACSRPSLQLEEQQTFRDATRSQTVEAPVSEPMDRLELDLSLELREGSLAFRVNDPQGVVRWEGTLQGGGQLTDRREFENPPAGTWRLDLDLAEASGKYKAEWTGY